MAPYGAKLFESDFVLINLLRMQTIIAFDAGTSGSKGVACYQSNEYPYKRVERHYLVNPSVRSLTKETYIDRLEFANEISGLSSNLVSYTDPSSGERLYWEVGESAAHPGLLNVRDRKFEKLLAKLLAFIGYLVRCEIHPSETVELVLGVLLPLDEIEDRRLLYRWLKTILGGGKSQSFEFNGIVIGNVRLQEADCKPEGYGVFKSQADDPLIVFIVGHSDSTWLHFDRGMLNPKLSRTLPETGMHDFIRTLRFPITNELQAAKIIARAGPKLERDILAQLTQTKTESEINELTQALIEAKKQYWSDRADQLKSLQTEGVTKIPTTGGFAVYSTGELNELFKELFGVKLSWCKPLIKNFCEKFQIRKKTALIYRFADVYGYYLSLVAMARKIEQEEKKSA